MLSTLQILDLVGIAVFAVSGALVASRKEMDFIGFALMASVTGIGGGTIRDVLLDKPVFWIETPHFVAVCLAIAIGVYFTAHVVQRRYVVVLWADAVGLSAYAVMGAAIALRSGANDLVAVVLGMITATFGGLVRDVICAEKPLLLKREVYATCAVAGAGTFVILFECSVPGPLACALGFLTSLALRAGGILFGWALPVYKARPGRDYG